MSDAYLTSRLLRNSYIHQLDVLKVEFTITKNVSILTEISYVSDLYIANEDMLETQYVEIKERMMEINDKWVRRKVNRIDKFKNVQ